MARLRSPVVSTSGPKAPFAELFAFLEGTTDATLSVNQQDANPLLEWGGPTVFGYSSSEVPWQSSSQILHGKGVLGSQVCREGCGILDCTGGRMEVPNFDLQARLHSGKRL